MSIMASQITDVSIAYSTVCSGAYQRKHQILAWLAFVRGIHRWPVNSPHRGWSTWEMFPFDDIIMWTNFGGTARKRSHWVACIIHLTDPHLGISQKDCRNNMLTMLTNSQWCEICFIDLHVMLNLWSNTIMHVWFNILPTLHLMWIKDIWICHLGINWDAPIYILSSKPWW